MMKKVKLSLIFLITLFFILSLFGYNYYLDWDSWSYEIGTIDYEQPGPDRYGLGEIVLYYNPEPINIFMLDKDATPVQYTIDKDKYYNDEKRSMRIEGLLQKNGKLKENSVKIKASSGSRKVDNEIKEFISNWEFTQNDTGKIEFIIGCRENRFEFDLTKLIISQKGIAKGNGLGRIRNFGKIKVHHGVHRGKKALN